MAHPEHTPGFALLEEAITVLFCLIDDAYTPICDPPGGNYASLKQLSDSERYSPSYSLSNSEGQSPNAPSCVRAPGSSLTCSPESSTFIPPLSTAECASSKALPGGLAACHLARELVGEPETLIVDSTLLFCAAPASGQAVVGEFGGGCVGEVGLLLGLRGQALHLLLATNPVPISQELTPANTADVGLLEELLAAANLGKEVSRGLLGELAYRSQKLEEDLAELGILLLTDEASARRPGVRQRVEIAFWSLKRVFGLGKTLAKTIVGLATRIAAKMTAYTYAFLINRMLGRTQGRIKDLWV